MTDKEKIRAFDEAIRKAQDVSHTSEFIKITDLFPQLAENEDEKIREFLIGILSQGTWRKEWPFSPNEVVAYLERQNHVQSDTEKEYVRTLKSLIFDFLRGKDEVDRDYYQRIEDWLDERHVEQKEQKPVECIEFTNEFENQISHLLASVLNDEYEYNEGFVKHAAQSLLGYAKNKIKSGELDKIERLMKALQAANAQIGELVEENYKLKEQKPAEIDEYEIIKKHITGDSLSSEINKRLNECGWYVTDKKPTKWSEDFEENIRTLLHNKLTWHSEDGNMSSTVFIDDKTLKDIVSGIWFYVGKEALKYPNKEIHVLEWSEEDADMLNCCISSIEEAKENRYAYKETDGDTSYDREINWLKSLYHQPRAKTNGYITPHKEFFEWIYNRLINVHGENPNVDYMRSFKERIDNLQFDKPHWKPSKQQIGALNYAYCELFKREDVGHNILGPLQELINNLKKLI